MLNNFCVFEELVSLICGFRIPDCGFGIRDSGFRFPGFRVTPHPAALSKSEAWRF